MRRFLLWKKKACLYCDSCWVESAVTVLVHNWLLNLDFFSSSQTRFPCKRESKCQKLFRFHNLEEDVPTCYKILVFYILAVSLSLRSCDERTGIHISHSSVLQRQATKKQWIEVWEAGEGQM